MELLEETAAEELGLHCGMFESDAATRLLKLTPRYDESPVFIRFNIYRKQNPMQIDDEEIGGILSLNNKIKILSSELKWSFRR